MLYTVLVQLLLTEVPHIVLQVLVQLLLTEVPHIVLQVLVQLLLTEVPPYCYCSSGSSSSSSGEGTTSSSCAGVKVEEEEMGEVGQREGERGEGGETIHRTPGAEEGRDTMATKVTNGELDVLWNPCRYVHVCHEMSCTPVHAIHIIYSDYNMYMYMNVYSAHVCQVEVHTHLDVNRVQVH